MNDFGTFTLGVFFGLIIAGIYLYFKVRSALSELDTLLNNTVSESYVNLTVEKHNGIFYGYNADDLAFVCQGKTLVEFRQAFQLACPGKSAVLVGGHDGVVDEFLKENKIG